MQDNIFSVDEKQDRLIQYALVWINRHDNQGEKKEEKEQGERDLEKRKHLFELCCQDDCGEERANRKDESIEIHPHCHGQVVINQNISWCDFLDFDFVEIRTSHHIRKLFYRHHHYV